MLTTKSTKDAHSEEIARCCVDAAIAVHSDLGPGLLESVYEECLQVELLDRGFSVERQKTIPVHYRDRRIDGGFRADLIVESTVLMELKSVETLTAVHVAQVLTYLKLGKFPIGFLLNFNTRLLRDGIKRLVVSFFAPFVPFVVFSL